MRGFLHASMVQALGTSVPVTVSVSPCRVPGCVGLAVDAGVKWASLSDASCARPCWLVPCMPHRLDHELKSPHVMIVSPTPVMQVEGWMYALIRISVSLTWCFYPDALRGPPIQVK